jgi:hypothetical protein
MSFRPSCKTYLPARYANNAGEDEARTHRHPAASSAAALSHGGPTPSTSMPSDSPPPLPLDSLDSDSQDKTLAPHLAPARSTGKRAASSLNTGYARASLLSRASSPSASTDIIDNDMPAAKKAKTLRPSDTVDDMGMHTDVQVMDINDVSDPREEALNKTDPTADIKFFFSPAPPAPGQTKVQMSCDLCMWVAFLLIVCSTHPNL